MAQSPSKIAVFLHAGDYDRMQQGLSIAAAAVAMGRRAEVYFFWWALQRLAEGRLGAPGEDELDARVADGFESKGMPTLEQLLSHLRESGLCTLYACTGSMRIVGAQAQRLEERVDQFVGWTTILKLTEGVVDRFYL